MWGPNRPLGTKDMVNNKFRIWLVRFGRTASLQIAYVAGATPHDLRLALHPNSDGQMRNLLLTIS